MADRILTLHPDPQKEGVNIERDKYDQIKSAIFASLEEHGELSFTELSELVNQRLAGQFDGSITWYVTTIKLDLEARGEIERIPGSKPQMLRVSS